MVHLVIFKDNTYAWIKYPKEAEIILSYNEMLARGLWMYRISLDEIRSGLNKARKLERNVVGFINGKYCTTLLIEGEYKDIEIISE